MSEIRDPIHSFIFFNELERALVDSRPVQRLKYVHQLALTYLVYPGATHTRFEHAIGTMELAGRAFDALARNSPDLTRTVFGDEDERKRWRATVRVAGLLHDIGHAPFSHAGDALFTGSIKNHEEMTEALILGDEVRKILTDLGTYRIHPEEVAHVASGLGTSASHAALVAKELITGDLGVDRMDYLRRDSHMCGVSYGLYDLPRLVETLMLARTDAGEVTLALEHGGMHAAEGLLTARYFMFSQVYFHDIRVAYDEHLYRFLKKHLPDERYPDDPDAYLGWDDIKVIGLAREHSGDVDAKAILEREHFRRAYELTPQQLRTGPNVVDSMAEQLDAKFGSEAFVKDSSKQTRSLQPGQILVVDSDTGQTEDILERSTTLEAFQPIWFVRAYASREKRTDVLKFVDSLFPKVREPSGEVAS